MSNATISLENVAVGYAHGRGKTSIVLDGLTAHLSRGLFACLIGENGIGKSTLLRTITGVQSPISGTVRLNGREITTYRHDELATMLSVVFTDRPDVGLLTAYDLVSLGRYPYTGWGGRLRPEDHRVIERVISQTGSESLADRPIVSLSDGERQRVMVARALAQEPAVMILDEPTAFLDLPRRVEMMGLLRRLTRETGLSVLLSTHDLDLAFSSADAIWLISASRRLVTGSPEDLAIAGSFERAFSSTGVRFDLASGNFTPTIASVEPVRLIGEGIRAVWTERMLRREGFAVVETSDEACAVVTCSPDRWVLEFQERRVECNSLESLARALQSRLGTDLERMRGTGEG